MTSVRPLAGWRNWHRLGEPGPQAMLLFRWAVFLLLLAAGVSFALYAATSQPRYKRWGLVILKWTLFAAFGFFGVLILERIL